MRRRLAIVGVLIMFGVGMLIAHPLRSADTRPKLKADAPSSEATAEPSSSSPILVPKCRIMLIDEAVLAAERPGVLAFVEPQEGDHVQANQEVVGLKDEVAQATYRTAKKRAENNVHVRYAEKASDLADTEYERAKEANVRVAGTVPDIELQQLRLAAERAALAIEQAQHEFEVNELLCAESEVDLKSYRVTASFDGIVVRVHKQKGEAVSLGEPILEVISTQRVKVEGYVDIKDALRTKPGALVRVRLDLDDTELQQEREVFEGRIVFVDHTVQPILEQVRVWAEVANRSNILRAGLTAQMEIDTTSAVATK